MAQQLHPLLGEPNDTRRRSSGGSRHQKRRNCSANAGFHASTGSSHLRNDEPDGDDLDSDNSDDGWTRSFGRVVPMAQQLQALVGEDSAHSRQYPLTRKHRAKGSSASNGVEHLQNDKPESLDCDKDAERTRNFGGSVPMARRLQELVGENSAQSIPRKQKGKGFHASNGSGHSRNVQIEGLDRDNGDDDWTRSSGRGVPLAQQLEVLLGDDCAHSEQYLSVQKQKGKGAADFEVEIVDTDDSNESWDEFPAEIAPVLSVVAKTHPLPSIEEQFQEALLAAPESASPPLLPFQITRDQASRYSTQLQRVLQLEKIQHAQITKGPLSKGAFSCIQVQILKKSLEGRLTTCKCQVVQAPVKWMRESSDASNVDIVDVIFNARVAVELELEVGGMVRINPPWHDVTLRGSFKRVILCTYFCEAVR